jgi:hypothetical protein
MVTIKMKEFYYFSIVVHHNILWDFIVMTVANVYDTQGAF